MDGFDQINSVEMNGPAESIGSGFFTDPSAYIYDLQIEKDRALLMPMQRDDFRASPFLDQRIHHSTDKLSACSIRRLVQVLSGLPVSGRPINFIFHGAFCGSTHLARCLDIDGRSLSYREPLSLHRLAMFKRRQPGQQQTGDALLRLVVRLLSRTFSDDEVALVKPSDTCNNLMPDLMAMQESSRALLVYADLRTFICAILKRKLRREWAHSTLARAVHDAGDFPDLPIIDHTGLDDAQAAAYIWIVNMYQFLHLLEGVDGRVATLDFARYREDPTNTLAGVAAHFALGLDETGIQGILHSDRYRQDSKLSAESYDSAARERDAESISRDYSAQISQAMDWYGGLGIAEKIPAVLPCPVGGFP